MNKFYFIITFFLLTVALKAQPNNVDIIVTKEGNQIVVSLLNGSAPQTISFSGFNLEFPVPSGTVLTIANNPYTLSEDASSTATNKVYVKPGTSVGVVFTPAPLEILRLTVTSAPTNPGLTQGMNPYVELAGLDRTGVAPIAAVPLPIKIRKFSAERHGNDRAADINWITSTEVNASHFDIERSEDGFEFSTVGTVDAVGNSRVDQYYAFLDRDLPTSRSSQDVFYYRLKMFDLDGHYDFTEIRSIRLDNDNTVEFSTYPNPTAGRVFVKMSTPDSDESEYTNANIFDLTGKLVMEQKVSTKGISEIDMDNLTNGSYIISINHNGKNHQNRVIKTN